MREWSNEWKYYAYPHPHTPADEESNNNNKTERSGIKAFGVSKVSKFIVIL